MGNPATYDIKDTSGDTWSKTFTLRALIPDPANPGKLINGDPLDLTGATVAAQIRTKAGDSTALATMTVTNTPLGADGQINLLLTPAQTQPLSTGVWDMQVTWPAVGEADPVVQTVVAGQVQFKTDVTRA